MLRTGRQYKDAVAGDGRRVFIDGERVDDVTAHPAFAPAVEHAAALYDRVREDPERMAYTVPDTGEPASRIWMMPRTQAELAERREAFRRWAEPNLGLFGRSQPHVATYLSSFAAAAPIFDDGAYDFTENVRNTYRHARDNDHYVTYSIVHPQVDRGKPAHKQADPYLAVGVCKERDDGIVLRGGTMLGTGTAISDSVLVSVIHPLPEGDEDYAFSTVVPVNADGLKVICRRGYAHAQPSTFDYPLSTRFDETDAFLVFDDVFVPWEKVMVYRNRELVRGQFYRTPGQVWANTFAQVRSLAKLQFLLGVTKRVIEMNGVQGVPQVREQMGRLASHVATVEAMLLAAEYECEWDEHGNAVPHRRYLYAAMGLHPDIHTAAMALVRELAGAGFLQVPSSEADFGNPEIAGDIAHYMRASDAPASEKIKLMKLAWDMVGSEFAGRQQQYELFFGGPPFLARMLANDNYGYETPDRLVEECLASYDGPGPAV